MKSTGPRAIVETFDDPPVAHALFGSVRWSWVWLVVRIYAGYQWLLAGWEKIHSPSWVGGSAGTALAGFVKGALGQVSGAHPNVQGWYGAFLQNTVLPNVGVWSYVVSIGEFLVGVALVLGVFTGIAAFFGSFMNMNYLLSGAVSTNPVLLVLEILIILAWKTAGWWGLDRWLLTGLGTPWTPGKLFGPQPASKV
jgi:thiosulfate dehydrogenase [quinone] large subunit